jgi:hypothetical protein
MQASDLAEQYEKLLSLARNSPPDEGNPLVLQAGEMYKLLLSAPNSQESVLKLFNHPDDYIASCAIADALDSEQKDKYFEYGAQRLLEIYSRDALTEFVLKRFNIPFEEID